MLRAIILSCALLSLTPVFARESTDVIVMKNGDHITCEIKGLDARRALYQLQLRPWDHFSAVVKGGTDGKQAVIPG